jgi:acetyl-CoA synthetase
VPRPDEITGQAIVAFVSLAGGVEKTDQLIANLGVHVGKEIGKLARPAEIRFADALPKTRSGKIMRRLLRDVAAGREIAGDTTTLEDISVIDSLQSE